MSGLVHAFGDLLPLVWLQRPITTVGQLSLRLVKAAGGWEDRSFVS